MNKTAEWRTKLSQGPQLLQLCVYGIIVFVLAVYALYYPAGLSQERFIGVVAALTLLLAFNLAWERAAGRAPAGMRTIMTWIFLVVSAALVLVTVWFGGQYDVLYLSSLICAQAGFKRGAWPAGVIFGLGNMAAWLVYLLATGMALSGIITIESNLAAGLIFVLLLVALLGRYADQTRRAEALLAELQAANARLEVAHQKEKDLAIAEERVRLARDIHDGLGHHLTVLSIQLQMAGKLVERDPQTAGEAIQACRVEAQAALEEVRRSVSLIRRSPCETPPPDEALADLLSSFERGAGIHVCLERSGSGEDLPAPVWETIYRTAQEGLTNVQKHARGVRNVTVRLCLSPGVARLAVIDDGSGGDSGRTPHGLADGAAPSSGFGLEGLRERAKQLGGSFRSGARETGGFEIEVCLPVQKSQSTRGNAA